MTDKKTDHLGLPLPHPENPLDTDCPRLVAALGMLDAHARATDSALQAHAGTIASLVASQDTGNKAIAEEMQKLGETQREHAMALEGIGPAGDGRAGLARAGDGLHVADAAGSLAVAAGAGIAIDAASRAVVADMDTVAKGILPVSHGGTGGANIVEARNNLGITALDTRVENYRTSVNNYFVRNAVLEGRMKDGYPDYLTYAREIDLQHKELVPHSRMGTVSASSFYNNDWHFTLPLRNQKVWLYNGWLTPDGIQQGWWQYDFKDYHQLCGLRLGLPGNNGSGFPAYWPKKWQLLGWNDNTNTWDVLIDREEDQSFFGFEGNNKNHTRTYWFWEKYSLKGYKRVRINIDSNHGAPNIMIGSIAFFEKNGTTGTNKAAITLQPITANVSLSPEQGVEARIESSAIPLTLCKEQSRNYVYLVPAKNGTYPGYLSGRSYTRLNNDFFALVDNRRIHYCSEEELQKECHALLSCNHATAHAPVPAGEFEHNQGAYSYPLYFYDVSVITQEPQLTGLKSAYQFTTDSSIYTNTSAIDNFPDKNMHPYSNEFTFECDFKWGGQTSIDQCHVLFDMGLHSGGSGSMISYNPLRKILYVGWSDYGCRFSSPANLNDNRWHRVSVSRNAIGTIFLHLDGKCIGMFDNTPENRPYYRQWALGRRLYDDWPHWVGAINNMRLTLGTCLYQGDNHSLAYSFNTTLIPDRTLWWNPQRQCVQEWDASVKDWCDAPMLPLGHIDTGWKEHLLTEQPIGTYHLNETKYIQEYDQSGSYWDGSGFRHTSKGLFNYGYAGDYPYATGPDNTTDEYWAEFTLEKPMQFSELHLLTTTWDWRASPCIFAFEGYDESRNRWDVLVNRLDFVDDGGLFQDSKTNGDSPALQGRKSFTIGHYGIPYRRYRMRFPAKGNVPHYNEYGHTACRIMLTLNGGLPEILDVKSYCIGPYWKYGPIPATVGQELVVPLPFENLPCSVDGFVEEENDLQMKRRKLGQFSYLYNQATEGETVYQGRDKLVVQFGNYSTSIWNDTAYGYNTHSVGARSVNANVYIMARREM